MTKKKVASIKVVTPVGMFSFPALDAPNAAGKFDKDQYKTNLLIKKEEMETEVGKALTKAVLKVGREFFGDPKLTLEGFKHPLVDGDKVKPEYNAGFCNIVAKNKNAPKIIGPDKEPLTLQQVKDIGYGDMGRLVVSVYPYTFGSGGVSLGLEVVQFYKKGEASSANREAALQLVDTLEVDIDEIDLGDGLPSEDAKAESGADDVLI